MSIITRSCHRIYNSSLSSLSILSSLSSLLTKSNSRYNRYYNGHIYYRQSVVRTIANLTNTSNYDTTNTTNSSNNSNNGNNSNYNGNVVVKLHSEKIKHLPAGTPFIYNNAIKDIAGNARTGDYVTVQLDSGKILGKGIYNKSSLYSVRMFVFKHENDIKKPFQEVIKTRLEQAYALRIQFKLGTESTNVYRLINGEGDRLSGLIIDVLGNTIVVQSSAAWIELHRAFLEHTLNVLMKPNRIIWRQVLNRLRLEGVDGINLNDKSNAISYGENASSFKEDCIADESTVASTMAESNFRTSVIESDVRYTVNPAGGQKTGFYCDQRDNRLLIRSLSSGRSVLDLYCYTGGFSLNAALGGARKVTAVDSSAEAIEIAKMNANDNGVQEKIDFVCEDAVKVMQRLKSSGQKFDLVICDPPKFAPTRKSLNSALRQYKLVNELAISLVASGGLMLTCSCSSAMSTPKDLLPNIIQQAAHVSNRHARIIKRISTGPDHPVDISCMESLYLSAALICVY